MIVERSAGLVTLANWTMSPDGGKYLYFFSKKWKILTDKSFPIEGFRSSEKWQLLALDKDDDIAAVFPGCQVKAWLRSENYPDKAAAGDIYSFE